jgi:hypothetical protein
VLFGFETLGSEEGGPDCAHATTAEAKARARVTAAFMAIASLDADSIAGDGSAGEKAYSKTKIGCAARTTLGVYVGCQTDYPN